MGQSRELREQQWDLHDAESKVPLEFTEENKPSLFGIDEQKAQSMVTGLSSTIAEREILKGSYIEVIKLEINTENLPTFKELRLKFVKNRTSIEKWHKVNKEFYLNGGRFVDAIKNKEIAENKEIEEKLMDAEKFFENQEKKRLQEINDARLVLVTPFVDSILGLDFTQMDEYTFDAFLEGLKAKKQALLIQVEADQKTKALEEKRIKEQELENAKLKAELQAKKDADAKAEIEKLKAERLAKAEADQLAKAPIKQQLLIWVNSFEIPLTTSDNATATGIVTKFESFKNWAKNEINKL